MLILPKRWSTVEFVKVTKGSRDQKSIDFMTQCYGVWATPDKQL